MPYPVRHFSFEKCELLLLSAFCFVKPSTGKTIKKTESHFALGKARKWGHYWNQTMLACCLAQALISVMPLPTIDLESTVRSPQVAPTNWFPVEDKISIPKSYSNLKSGRANKQTTRVKRLYWKKCVSKKEKQPSLVITHFGKDSNLVESLPGLLCQHRMVADKEWEFCFWVVEL